MCKTFLINICLFYLGDPTSGLEEYTEEMTHTSCPCRICHIVFSNMDDLASHDRSHGNVDWRCRVCWLDCRDMGQLRIHLQSVHSQYKHFCYMCGRAFKSYSSLNAHNRLFHRPGSSCPVCKICGKIYAYESHLKIHSKKHLDEQPFFCEVCGKTYKSKWHLKENKCRSVQKPE